MIFGRHLFPNRLKMAAVTVVGCMVLTALVSHRSMGQESVSKEEKEPTPSPVQIPLTTKDGVTLSAVYFPPILKKEDGKENQKNKEDEDQDGKSVVPYIVLHDWEGSKDETKMFATYLQNQGNAVLIPDLRGHGQSSTMSLGGQSIELDYKKIKPNQIVTVMADIEACKKQLVQFNNEGQLNIDMLTVVAIGKTAPIAVQWVIDDWYKFPTYNGDGIKQARDVKMLVLVSPEKKHGPFRLDRSLKHDLFVGATPLPLVVMWGGSNENAKSTESILKKMKKALEGRKQGGDQKPETLVTARLPTAASGRDIISNDKMANVWNRLEGFVKRNIASQAEELLWQDRSKQQQN